MPNSTDGGFILSEVPWLPPACNYVQVSIDGACAALFGSRTSDCTNPGRDLPIGFASVAVCDSDHPAWGGYIEVRLKSNGESFAAGIEIEAINEKPTNNKINPYNIIPEAGLAPLWIGSGGSVSTSINPDKTPIYPADMVMGILNNGQTFRYGITFQNTSLAGCDGVNGQAEAVGLAKGHQINWYSQAGQQLSITSQATQPASAIELVATDWGLNIQSGGWAVANFFPTFMLQPTGTSLALLLKTEAGNLQLKQVVVGPVDVTGHRHLMVPA